MLEFAFIRRTLMVGFMLSVMIPLIGVVMVTRKTSMMGDALSHSSLAGIGMGLILNIEPMIGAIIICIVSAFAIEGIRRAYPQYGDMATAVIMSIGLGLASILSDFSPGGHSFESYLFGSISSSTRTDLLLVAVMFCIVVTSSVVNYSGLLSITIDPNLARLSGVRVQWLNRLFTLLTAITVALSAKIVGALLVTSMIVLPVATALMLGKSYKRVCQISILLGVFYMMAGLILSFYFDIKPGGAIVIFVILGMGVSFLIRHFRKKLPARTL